MAGSGLAFTIAGLTVVNLLFLGFGGPRFRWSEAGRRATVDALCRKRVANREGSSTVPPSSRPSLVTTLQVTIVLIVGVLYLATRQHVFTIDSYYYLWDTEFGDWSRLLHPHHLMLQPLLRGWWRLWQWFEWSGRAVLPLQVLNVMLTLGSLLVAWRLLRWFLPHRGLAAAWWSLLAVGYLTWSQATQADSLPLFSLFATALLWWAARLSLGPAPTTRTALGLALTLAGGILAHQVLVLWALPLGWMLGRRHVGPARLRSAALALGASAALVLACYVAAGSVATDSTHPADLWRWFTGYSEEFAGRCGRLANLVSPDVPRGLASALLSGGPLKPFIYGERPPGLDLISRLIPFLLLFGTLAAGLWPVFAWRRDRDADLARAVLHVALLMAISALFAAWWDPAQRKFWAPVATGLVVLSSLGWSWRAPRQSALLAVPVIALAAVVLAYNLSGGILPRHRDHDARQPLVAFLARHVHEHDTMILREDRVWQAAIYFRPEKPVHGLPGPFSDRDDPGHTVLEAALDDARRALRQGGTVYVSDQEWPRVRGLLEDDLGPLPPPEAVMPYGDAELGDPDQMLLALRLARG